MKALKLITIASVALSMTACSSINIQRDNAQGHAVAATADMASTFAAIDAGGFEGNPLGVSGVIASKFAVGYILETTITNEQAKKRAFKTLNAAQAGATVNNLLIAAGGVLAYAVPFGVIAGVMFYEGVEHKGHKLIGCPTGSLDETVDFEGCE